MADADITIGGDLENLSEKLGKSVEETLNTVAGAIYTELILNNPVKTGFSASNWNVSLGEPDLTVNGIRDPNGSYAPDAQKDIPKNPDLEEVYIANGVEYIQFLNEGTSQQAPAGWIEAAIDRVESSVQDVLDEKLDANQFGK